MSTIADKLKIISDSCTEIKEAIVAKGGTVTGNLTTYGDSIRGLQVGGSDKGRETWDVTFVDYDGTILSHYEIPMNGTVVFPDAPNHEDEGLIFDEWNCTETDASKYYDDEMYRTIVIGPIYHRSKEWEDAYYADYNSKCAFDEYTHIYMTYPKTGVAYGLRIQPTVADGVVIDWGDGTTTTTNASSLKLYRHTYTEIPQSKEITVKANSGTYIFQGTNNSTSSIAFVNFSDTKPDVKIGNTVTSIGNYAFASCNGLQSIKIPASVTSIGNYAFLGCNGLQSIQIPSSLTSIGNNAFASCYGLQNITIPASVTSIGISAFQNCYGLNSIVIPSSVTKISSGAFEDCYSLICSYYGEWIMTSKNTFYLTNSKNTNNNTIYYCNIYNRQLSVKKYNGGESIDVTIPASVKSIHDYAFYNCYGLWSVTIPSSVKSIYDYVFSDCYALKSVVIPSSVTFIGSGAFQSCYSLQSVVIPSSITKIYSNMFYYCYSLQSVVIPSSVTSIGISAFQNCYSLQSVVIPSSVTSIGSSAFQSCYGLKIVDYGNDRTTVPPPPSGLPTDRAIRYIIVPDAVYDATYVNSSWSTWKDYLIKYSDYYSGEKQYNTITLGGGAYFKTDVQPTRDITVEACFKHDSKKEGCLFGVSTNKDNWYEDGKIFAINVAEDYLKAFVSEFHSKIATCSENEWHTVSLKGINVVFDGGEYAITEGNTNYYGYTQNIYIGARNCEGITVDDFSKNKTFIYKYIKIYNNGELIREYVPMLKNGVACLQEKCSGTFVYKNGGGYVTVE